MSKKTSYILGIFLTIILGSILYYLLCCKCCKNKVCNHSKKENNLKVAVPEIKNATKNDFTLTDAQGNFEIKMQDNLNFKMSNFLILKPISPNVTNGVIKLKNYLAENPLKTVQVTGYYKTDEINNSAYPNLGLARANSVKNFLVSQGVSSKQIDTYGAINNDIYPDESKTLFGPLKFGLLTTDDTDMSSSEALKIACEAIKNNPLVLNFNTGQSKINLTIAQRQKIASISRCVDKLGVKVLIVGHTDNTGDASNNIILGQGRADFAKDYLMRNGILGNHIEAISKGQTEPIADNTTEEGKTKNRRTVITIN